MEVSDQFQVPAALPRGKDPRTHLIRGWVDLGAGLDAVAMREKNLIIASAWNEL
jgi:hypothetical protein